MERKFKLLVELTIDDDITEGHDGELDEAAKDYLETLLDETAVRDVSVKQVWESRPNWIELYREGVQVLAPEDPGDE